LDHRSILSFKRQTFRHH